MSRTVDRDDAIILRKEIHRSKFEILGVSVRGVKPTPDTARALEAEAREAILKGADEAIYARRNFAVA